MPLYAYECSNCGVRFERRQGFDDAPITVCPECEGQVHRLIQPAGIVFKGSGFYSTDHKSSRSDFSGKKSAGASSESKPESKAEAPVKTTASDSKD